MAGRDHYNTLGVPRGAGADDIRRAYRKLARQHHPDVNKSPDAAAKFAEIQAAYDVLSDDQKRRLYDQYGDAFASGASGAEPFSARKSASGGRGGESHFDFDVEDLSSMFDAMFGSRASSDTGSGRRGSRGRRQASPESPPLHHDLHIPFITAVKGGSQSLQLQSEQGNRTVEVNIPAGIHDGATLRVRNPMGKPGGPDLLITLRVGEHPFFRRGDSGPTGSGHDLFVDLPLTIAEATLGATVTAPTLEGDVELTIPPGTASGKRLRLKGQGIRASSGEVGDLYAVIKIVPPRLEDLTEQERAALRSFSSRGPSPRDRGHAS